MSNLMTSDERMSELRCATGGLNDDDFKKVLRYADVLSIKNNRVKKFSINKDGILKKDSFIVKLII